MVTAKPTTAKAVKQTRKPAAKQNPGIVINDLDRELTGVQGKPFEVRPEKKIFGDDGEVIKIVPAENATFRDLIVRALVNASKEKESAMDSFKNANLAHQIQNCGDEFKPNSKQVDIIKAKVAAAFPSPDIIYCVYCILDPNLLE